ncbi:hypothetical protein JCM11641_004162 [Rhodosporidiobolus odoratus]
MGLEYFADTCNAPATMDAASIWCVMKEGTCCAVCPNTLASLGTRIGLTFTAFFATIVVVVDGAEAPFIFLTTCFQALAYISSVLYLGLAGDGISRFHAYYSLFSSLGFLSPLAAASVTAPHYLYGGNHPKTGQGLLAMRTDIKRDIATPRMRPAVPHAHSLGKRSRGYHQLEEVPRAHGGLTSFTMRSLGASPFFASVHRSGRNARRPLTSTDPFKHYEGTSEEPSPVLMPIDASAPIREGPQGYSRRSNRVKQGHPQDEEAVLESPPLRATPSDTPNPDALNYSPPLPPAHRSPRIAPATPSALLNLPPPGDLVASPPIRPPRPRFILPHTEEYVNGLTALPGPALPAAPLSASHASAVRRGPTKLNKRALKQLEGRTQSPPPYRHLSHIASDASSSSSSSHSTVYDHEQKRRIERATQGGAWRRYGMLGANVALWILWLFTFLVVHQVFGSFKVIQANCEDPTGLKLLIESTIVFLCISVIIFVVFIFNFYSQWLHRRLRAIFDYSRHSNRWTRLAVPAVFGGSVFTLWLTLLWTSYELAAQPSSSLLAATEQSATFPTVLSIALTIKPVCDLIKAVFKSYKRRRRERKEAARKEREQREQHRRGLLGPSNVAHHDRAALAETRTIDEDLPRRSSASHRTAHAVEEEEASEDDHDEDDDRSAFSAPHSERPSPEYEESDEGRHRRHSRRHAVKSWAKGQTSSLSRGRRSGEDRGVAERSRPTTG